ncbi:11907_t:CDS:2 [Dentiscutata heterogama]|uniref:11907_t:CDS:1 n=1 Tax=Dentiscutata heterogama TaxID=1316150 RepID=A0ACA9K4X7_9GLOM|nr:11907_t:CDS:2 [Dentiscutata heterogama]
MVVNSICIYDNSQLKLELWKTLFRASRINQLTSENVETSLFSNNIYALDINSYTWVTRINTNITTNQSTTGTTANTANTQSDNDKLYIGIGIGIGGIIFVGILIAGGFLIYKKQKEDTEIMVGIPGSMDERIRETHTPMAI